MYLKEKGCKGVNWTELSQDRGQWLAVVKTAVNIAFRRRSEIS
jgi:hypothetical protein